MTKRYSSPVETNKEIFKVGFCMCVMCVLMHVSICVGTHICECMFLWRTDVDMGVFLDFFPPYVFSRVFHLNTKA